MATKKTTETEEQTAEVNTPEAENITKQPLGAECHDSYLEAQKALEELRKGSCNNLSKLLEKDMALKKKTLAAVENMIVNNQDPSNEIQIKILETAAKLYHVIVTNNNNYF